MKLWISKPVITVKVYMVSCRPISAMSFSFKTSPPTKKRIPTGEYLWEKGGKVTAGGKRKHVFQRMMPFDSDS